MAFIDAKCDADAIEPRAACSRHVPYSLQPAGNHTQRIHIAEQELEISVRINPECAQGVSPKNTANSHLTTTGALYKHLSSSHYVTRALRMFRIPRRSVRNWNRHKIKMRLVAPSLPLIMTQVTREDKSTRQSVKCRNSNQQRNQFPEIAKEQALIQFLS